MSFEKLGLSGSLLRAVNAEGYHTATPIQEQAIPIVLAGHDLMGCAQTGTGKTAAFALPTLHRLGTCNRPSAEAGERRPSARRRPIRSLILAPTRELAAQIQASFTAYGKFTGLRSTVIFGGVNQGPQVRALQAGVDILVATPGRLLDLMNQGHVNLKDVEILILDEADQMLDMGFLPDLKRIVAAVPRRDQTLMFSATMPSEIRQLAAKWLRDPKHVQVGPVATPIELVSQSVYFVDARHKPELLAHYLRTMPGTRTLVFARTKHGADKIVKQLVRSGIRAAAIHGNKSQNVRTRTLEQFKSERPPVLVATDLAARGLDVDGISHVINYELPEVPEIYVHRIGRTGRAGATGIATSFCGGDERSRLRQIERLTRRPIPVEQHHPEYSQSAPSSSGATSAGPAGQRQTSGRPPATKKNRRTRARRPASFGDRTTAAPAGRPPKKKPRRAPLGR